MTALPPPPELHLGLPLVRPDHPSSPMWWQPWVRRGPDLILGTFAGAYVLRDYDWPWAVIAGIGVMGIAVVSGDLRRRQLIVWAQQARATGLDWRWVPAAETDVNLLELVAPGMGIAVLAIALERVFDLRLDLAYGLPAVVIVSAASKVLLAGRRVERLFGNPPPKRR